MALSRLTLNNFRNIHKAEITANSGINLFLGKNGSGKTSLLEAIHLLSLGRSFRTRNLKNAVQEGQDTLQVVAQIAPSNVPLGVQFSSVTPRAPLQIRLNRTPVKRLADLALQLPLQLITANCHQFFEQGPRYRRQLMDWGLFHVEPGFYPQWQHYRRALKQRNAAIKQRHTAPQIQLWDAHLSSYGEAIHVYRLRHLERLLDKFRQQFPLLCPEFSTADFSLRYQSGWLKQQSLSENLGVNLARDCALGYTRSGAHAADWQIRINQHSPIEFLSRGQQKLFALALRISQALLLSEYGAPPSILLFDDLSSELDLAHQQTVFTAIAQMPLQAFITSTDMALKEMAKPFENSTTFHVEQGEIIIDKV